MPLLHYSSGLMPIRTLTDNFNSVPLPIFDVESGKSLAQLATAVSPAMLEGARRVNMTEAHPLTPPVLVQYSATTRLLPKLEARIQALEIIEMSEVLPWTWLPDHQEAASTPRRPSQSTPVTDILVWTQCFAVMVAVLAEQFPDKAPQLLAYLSRIVQAATNFQRRTTGFTDGKPWPSVALTGIILRRTQAPTMFPSLARPKPSPGAIIA